MTYRVNIRATAKRDIARARDYYATEASHEVARFARELRKVVKAVGREPKVPRVVLADARAWHLKGHFPYEVWYVVFDDLELVDVVALVHDRQDPEQFTPRLSS